MTDYVRGIVFDDNQHVLLQMRGDCPIWELPGGGVECGEMLSVAMARELREETGLAAKSCQLCSIHHRWIASDYMLQHDVMFGHICHIEDIKTLKLTEEAIN